MQERNISNKLSDIAGKFENERNYWLEKLAGDLTKSSFPYEYRHTQEKGAPDVFEFDIEEGAFRELMNICKNSEHRMHLFFLAILSILLKKYTGSSDIVIGSPIYKQEADAGFVNTVLPLRNQIRSDSSFKELLLQVKDTIQEANKNQNYPIEKLVEELGLTSTENDFALFDVALLIENIHEKKYIQHIGNNITFSFVSTGANLKGMVEYNPLRYPGVSIKGLVAHFLNLLRQVLANIDLKVSDMEILSENETKQLVFEYNNTAVDKPETTLHGLFELQVEKTPGNIAVIQEQRQVTYRELNEKANGLARLLISRGVGPETIVGITAERSVEMIVGIMGILKAGGAYLPISPELPLTRKQFMLSDSNTRFLVTTRPAMAAGGKIESWDGENIVIEDVEPGGGESPGTHGAASGLAYIIYTSGSTGRPKGVLIEHRGAVNYIHWAAGQYIQGETAAFPLYTSFSFDLTVTSIFTPLISGNPVVIYGGDEKEFLIKKVIEENAVKVVKATPSHLKLIREVVQKGEGKNIKRFIVGGEDLSTQSARDIVQMFDGDIEIYNEYGPTETVVGSMIYKFNPADDTGDSVSIGTPIHNTQIYLLDENKKPVPFGVSGELFISGHGVARGYLNRPRLTAEKFVENPFLPGQKMYATGDLGIRYPNPDGNIQFLGRRDEQVKIRGFRVELGEIENTIRNFNRNEETSIPGEPELQLSTPDTVVRCGKCLLPENYPGVEFDGDGVCQECRQYENSYKMHLDKYFKKAEDFQRLVGEIKANTPASAKYDCLLLFSGGKDSTFVLYRLIDMGLKVLAFTFDNGYISDAAFKNIRRTTSMLNVELIVGNLETMNQVFVESLISNQNVCHGCWHALNTYAITIAREKGIDAIVSGLSRGQIFDMRLEGLFQAGVFDENEIEEKLLSFRKTFHSRDNKYFRLSRLELEENAIDTIQFVDFFRYFELTTPEIKAYLSSKGWVQPSDTGFCSSNCLINDVGIYMFLKERGLHFYAAPLSWDIRLGVLTREDGLKEMGFGADLREVGRILDEINYYTLPTIKDAVVLDNEDDSGNKYLCAYIVPEDEAVLSETALREYLSGELPDYMIPSYFVQVDEIPLSPSGKADKKALLKLEGARLQTSTVYVEPRDEKEKRVAELCKEIFSIDKIGINDNFFSLGATSFSIIQLNNRLKDVFNKDISVLTLFEHPNIASFLEYVELDIPAPIDAAEEENWAASRKEGQNKFKRLRKKRIQDEDEDM